MLTFGGRQGSACVAARVLLSLPQALETLTVTVEVPGLNLYLALICPVAGTNWNPWSGLPLTVTEISALFLTLVTVPLSSWVASVRSTGVREMLTFGGRQGSASVAARVLLSLPQALETLTVTVEVPGLNLYLAADLPGSRNKLESLVGTAVDGHRDIGFVFDIGHSPAEFMGGIGAVHRGEGDVDLWREAGFGIFSGNIIDTDSAVIFPAIILGDQLDGIHTLS